MWKWETNQADSLGSPGSVWGVPCASLLSNELSHTPYRKGKGEALALGKAEALAQRRELRTNQASYRKLHQSPRHWAPNHPGGRRWEHKPRRSTVTLRRPPAYLRGLEPTSGVPSDLGGAM